MDVRCAMHADNAWSVQSVHEVLASYGTHTAALQEHIPLALLLTFLLWHLLLQRLGMEVRSLGDNGLCPKRPPLELIIQFPILTWFTASGVIITLTTCYY